MLSSEARRSFTKYACRLGQPSISFLILSRGRTQSSRSPISTIGCAVSGSQKRLTIAISGITSQRAGGHVLAYNDNVINKRGFTVVRTTGYGLVWSLENVTWETGSRQFSSTTGSRTAFYDVLEITPRATQAQVKQAFYRLSKLYHPDINKTKEAKDKYTQIVEAYETLGNKRHRRMYDSGIFSTEHGSSEGQYEDPRTYRPEGGFKKRNQAPPKGRSGVYNYDEFYRMHYKETFQRAKNIRREKENEDKTKTAYGTEDSKHLVSVALMFSIVVYILVRSQR